MQIAPRIENCEYSPFVLTHCLRVLKVLRVWRLTLTSFGFYWNLKLLQLYSPQLMHSFSEPDSEVKRVSQVVPGSRA